MLRRNFNILSLEFLPLWIFVIVYIATCLLGSLIMLAGSQVFNAKFYIQTGTIVPSLTSQQFFTNLYLLIVLPFLLSLSYFFTIRNGWVEKKIYLEPRPVSEKISMYLYTRILYLVFFCLAALALTKLIKTGDFYLQSAWFSYDNFIKARYILFRHLNFFDFLNIYLLLPICAIWIAFVWQTKNSFLSLFRWIPITIAIVLNILIFQKKPTILVVFLFTVSWIIYYSITMKELFYKRSLKLMLLSIAIILAVYFILLLAPVFLLKTSVANPSLSSFTQVDHKDKNKSVKGVIEPLNLKKTMETQKTVGIQNYYFLFTYSLIAPITRTSAPALYYSIIFPKHHSFYGLDLGQDMFGFGRMPNDNVVVWQYMNPTMPNGAVAVPFQFALYSQVGIIGSTICVILVGIILSIVWKLIICNYIKQAIVSSLLGGLVLLFSLYLALDSGRNALLASYGIIWGVLFVFGIFLLRKIVLFIIAKFNPSLYLQN